MRKVGFLVLVYDIGASIGIFIWWGGIALGIGDSGFKFSFATKGLTDFCTTTSWIFTLISICLLLMGSVALIFHKLFGKNISILGLGVWLIGVLLLIPPTFLYNLESSSYSIIDILYAVFVMAMLILIFVLPALRILRELKKLHR